MKDFFISYNSADKAWAEWIAWQLEEARYPVEIQAWDSRPGANMIEWMDHASRSCKRTIAVCSESYFNGQYSKAEWTEAFYREKLLPVRIQDFAIAGLLGPITYIDLVGLKADVATAALLSGIKAERIKPVSKPIFPGGARRGNIAEPDYPGIKRSAIKGLRSFGYEDAELFLRLEREHELRQCYDAITSREFRLGYLVGESGCGKSSFLQAGLWPLLAKHSENHHPIYVKFTNLDPLETIRQALLEQSPVALNDADGSDFLTLLGKAARAQKQTLVLFFDQFEQFFVHNPREEQRQLFTTAMIDWYRKSSTLPVRILFSLRRDFFGHHLELQKAMGYSLGPQDFFQLKKFTPKQATDIFLVIAESEELSFDRSFVEEMTGQELVSREDGLISPVDIQILSWVIAGHQDKGETGFSRSAYQKMGGIEGLLENYLARALSTVASESQKQIALKVLLALIDLERNVRAGVLTAEQIKQKLAKDTADDDDQRAVAWLAQSKVRLITPVKRKETHGYELAHERLIQPVRSLTSKELSEVDQTNMLLERRVNEWLGNDRSDRYLFTWQELRRIKKQIPYLVWGKQEEQKQELLKRSHGRFRRRAAVALIPGLLLFFLLVQWQTVVDVIVQHLERLESKNYREQLHSRAKDSEAMQRREDLGVEFINVPGGTLEMGDLWGDGDSDEKPVHTVTVTSFRISKYEITNEQYCAFLNSEGNQIESDVDWIYIPFSRIEDRDGQFVPKSGYENHPVVFVTWYGARAFARWIGGELPTEAQWEYAARSGGRTDREFPWGNEFDGSKANFADRNTRYTWSSSEWDDGYINTAPVGNYPPNDLGLYDMAGNVWEWCNDWYGKYRDNSQSDPVGSYRGDRRVLRGGSFYNCHLRVRCSNRNRNSPNDGSDDYGFRVVASP